MVPRTYLWFPPLETPFMSGLLVRTWRLVGSIVLPSSSFNLAPLVNISFRRLLARYPIEDLTMDNLATGH